MPPRSKDNEDEILDVHPELQAALDKLTGNTAGLWIQIFRKNEDGDFKALTKFKQWQEFNETAVADRFGGGTYRWMLKDKKGISRGSGQFEVDNEYVPSIDFEETEHNMLPQQISRGLESVDEIEKRIRAEYENRELRNTLNNLMNEIRDLKTNPPQQSNNNEILLAILGMQPKITDLAALVNHKPTPMNELMESFKMMKELMPDGEYRKEDGSFDWSALVPHFLDFVKTMKTARSAPPARTPAVNQQNRQIPTRQQPKQLPQTPVEEKPQLKLAGSEKVEPENIEPTQIETPPEIDPIQQTIATLIFVGADIEDSEDDYAVILTDVLAKAEINAKQWIGEKSAEEFAKQMILFNENFAQVEDYLIKVINAIKNMDYEVEDNDEKDGQHELEENENA
jgi:uncharacterized protein YukE